MMRYIKYIGLELEGGMCEKGLIHLSNIMRGSGDRYYEGYDGSVHVPRPPHCEQHCELSNECDRFFRYSWYNDVELKFMSDSLDEIREFVETVWSLGFKQNETCGNHMHFSFNNNNLYMISLLSSWDFVKYYINKYINTYKSKEKYMRRLENNYCRAIKSHDDLIKNITEDRYYMINFRAVYKHSTIEIRIMPYADNAEEYIEMLLFNVNTIESYLDRTLKKKKITIHVGNIANEINLRELKKRAKTIKSKVVDEEVI